MHLLPCPQEEPYWEEALAFTRSVALQRDCEVEVHSVDRAGNFQGAVRFGRINLGGEGGGHACPGPGQEAVGRVDANS